MSPPWDVGGEKGARAILLEPPGAAPPAGFGQWALGAAAAPTVVPPAGGVSRSGPPRVERRASHLPAFQALTGGPQEPLLGLGLRGSFSGSPSGPAVGALGFSQDQLALCGLAGVEPEGEKGGLPVWRPGSWDSGPGLFT